MQINSTRLCLYVLLLIADLYFIAPIHEFGAQNAILFIPQKYNNRSQTRHSANNRKELHCDWVRQHLCFLNAFSIQWYVDDGVFTNVGSICQIYNYITFEKDQVYFPILQNFPSILSFFLSRRKWFILQRLSYKGKSLMPMQQKLSFHYFAKA